MRLDTLKKRGDFLRIRGGARWSGPSFVLETRARDEHDGGGPRFGFTITRKIGGAVDRNRIRRRLKAAVAAIAPAGARPGHDYVLVARTPALTQPFDALKKELEDAFHRVHHPRRDKRRP